MTVVETAEFLKKARSLMPELAREDLVAFIAQNPESGEIIPETGGVRKIRWALQGKGKRGGARVIYYFHNENFPLFLLTAYAKNQKENLTNAERNEMQRLVPLLTAGYPKKS